MPAHHKGVATTHPKDYDDHDRLLTTKEAAQLATHWRALYSPDAAVSEAAIRQWRHRGHLKPADLDHHGRALYHRDDLADAERAARDIALNPQLATRPRALRLVGIRAVQPAGR